MASQLTPGDLLAIHAGARLGGGHSMDAHLSVSMVLDAAREDAKANGEECWVVRSDVEGCQRSAIVAVCTYLGWDDDDQTAWDIDGCKHWRLAQIFALPSPIPCAGRLGLWTLPGDVELLVMRQLAGFGS